MHVMPDFVPASPFHKRDGDPGKANEANAASKILIFDIAEPKGLVLAQ